MNIYSHNLRQCWKPSIYSKEYINKYVNKSIEVVEGISVPFKLTYTKNYGHAIWDDLYSIFVSITKLGYKDEPFKLIIPKNNTNVNPHFLSDIYYTMEKFSKRKILFLENCNSNILLFKNLIVGSSHQCQRCVTTDYSLKYSRKYNITKILRDRMYEVFNILPKFQYPIEGIIVHNKRYSKYEISILHRIIRNSNKKELKLYYIDYMKISTFYKQLLLLSRIHIYISGPGTGLLNFPFMADPGVVIHLGHIHYGCPQYLEQYMLEGSPQYKAFYYSPKERMNKFSYNYIRKLINKSMKYIIEHKIIYVKEKENLNEIGKLFVQICEKYNKECIKLINNYDWGYGECRGIWAENVIYFPSVYKRNPEIVHIVKFLNLTYNLGCKIGSNYSSQKQCK